MVATLCGVAPGGAVSPPIPLTLGHRPSESEPIEGVPRTSRLGFRAVLAQLVIARTLAPLVLGDIAPKLARIGVVIAPGRLCLLRLSHRMERRYDCHGIEPLSPWGHQYARVLRPLWCMTS